jgi:hypothetical protein
MSTGFEHSDTHHISFESIDHHLRAFDLTVLTSQGAVQESKSERLARTYAMVRPILLAVTAIPFIPTTWRAALRIFMAALDEVTASFKAGKDLATDDGGPVEQMEPKAPVG